MKTRWSRREFLKTTTAAVVLGAAENHWAPRQFTAEAPPRQDRRDGFLHRLRLRHALLLHRKRRRRAGPTGDKRSTSASIISIPQVRTHGVQSKD